MINNMENWQIATTVTAVIFAALVFWYISARNRFARYAVKITESGSGIDVALTKRYDTLTKMLDITKGYAEYESELLVNIVNIRKGMSSGERTEANRMLDELSGRINALAESYPDLKAGENYKQLQLAVADTEEHLQAARRIFNMNVSYFNQLLATWPNSIVGSGMGYAPMEFFEAEERKKADVKMEF